MNQSDNTFSAGDIAPNPFTQAGSDHHAIPAIPGFDMGAAARRPAINVHGLLTLAILAIAAVAIWGMRSIGLRGQTGVMAQEVQDAMSIDTNKKAVMTVEDQRLLADLTASRTANQVPGDDLQKNPFALSDAARPKPKTLPGEPLPPTATDEEIKAARQRDLLAMLAEFKLQGVMGGATGVARINGRPYRVGDEFGAEAANRTAPAGPSPSAVRFTVTAIDGREVTVSAEGFNFILSMDVH
ncbi:MAG: hypothetical protein K2Q09_07130 [Phycisphaerales bacterium]|nr:hypothetical protein [Phycisphaerales bacterium]